MGAITKTIGNAMSHDGSQALTQRPRNPSAGSTFPKVEMPETRKDISAERMKPNRMGPD
jgi:hypothetical protein